MKLITSLLAAAQTLAAADTPTNFTVRQWRPSPDPTRATVRVRADQRSPHAVPRFITGKFAEHLGWNIYNGMDAQVLKNPTFADYPFATGQTTPDGIVTFHWEDHRINEELRRQAARFGWPEAELANLERARADALACFWTRAGSRDEVVFSPDVGPRGGRAQRVETKAPRLGIAQWIWLPLHRVRSYEIEVLARSTAPATLLIALESDEHESSARAEAAIRGLAPEWRCATNRLEVPAHVPADRPFRLVLRVEAPGAIVLAHVFLRPTDHVQGADADVVRLLRESRLPLLRWPGGNFVSGYHWEDGIGPVEARPTVPNYAWGGVEPNTFGTDEFIAFCRAVGCEPMICVNAGSGTPAEAARWLEYCNGGPQTSMGRRRAANGHAEPYGVKHWEIGNELWGRWQYFWTTASGNVDRYHAFAAAMGAVDPTIRLYACGAPVFWGQAWNQTLVAGAAKECRIITDHPLIGGNVEVSAEPLDVYRDFMAVPEVLEQKWAALQSQMHGAGMPDPALAVTELQVFAHLGRRGDTNQPVRLTRQNLPGQGSITEAIYDVLVYHAALRLAPFVEMVTHSAVVNHGGGLRKERERVYANPCHYAQSAFAALAGATLVALELESAAETAPRVLPDLRQATPEARYSALDALGALAPDGSLLLSLVHRGSHGPLRLDIDLGRFTPAGRAEVWRLSAETPWAGNTFEQPNAVVPIIETAPVREGKIELELKPFTVARVRVPAVP
jgi:alpha-N-arabinofuranosidase